MKKNFTLLLFLPTMFALNANAQEDFEDQLPKSLVVFHNPNVKGVRLDSIVTRVYDNQHVLISQGVYLDRISNFDEYDSKVVFDYPEDGGAPTRRLVSGYFDYDYWANIPVNYDKVINGIKLAYKKNYFISFGNNEKRDTLGYTELLGDFPVKKVSLKDGVVTSETSYEYNNNLDMTLRLRKNFDAEGNVTGGEKVTVDYKDGYRTEISHNYDTAKKDFIPVRKTVTKSVNDYGWITEKYIYDADAEGNFGESSYSLVMNVDDDDFPDLEIRDVRGVMTVMEDGVKKEYKVSTDYIFKDIAEMAEHGCYNDYIEYAATYKLNDNGDKAEEDDDEYVDIDEDEKVDREAVPFMIERLYPTFFSKNIDTKFQLVDLLNGGEKESVEVLMYDDYGYLSTRYSTPVKGYSDAKTCMEDLEKADFHNLNVYNGVEFGYLYENEVNVGWTHNYDTSFGYCGFSNNRCVRDTKYRNVKGSDAICPIIYSIGRYDWSPSFAYSIYYYSSEDATLEARHNATAITDIADDSKPAPAVIYDVQGKQVKTCANGNVTLPNTKGIYIIRQGNNVMKMKK